MLQKQQLNEKTIKRKVFEYKKIKDKGDSKVWFYLLIYYILILYNVQMYISWVIKFSLTY